MPESCSWIASVSAVDVALANDLALQQKLELLASAAFWLASAGELQLDS